MSNTSMIDPSIPPSGDGCVECLRDGGWWFHLRRCAACGHIGCCDSSPGGHATRHAHESGHDVAQSFEPGESWFWDYRLRREVSGPQLASPQSHTLDQPVPGPNGRVPDDWMSRLR